LLMLKFWSVVLMPLLCSCSFFIFQSVLESQSSPRGLHVVPLSSSCFFFCSSYFSIGCFLACVPVARWW
jgi:hypothetical protein